MYSSRDYEDVKKAYNKFLGLYIAMTMVFIAAGVASCIVRISWSGYAAASIWAILTVFLWGFRGGRLDRYKKYLKEISIGMQHVIEGTVNNIEDGIYLRDGVEFYCLDILLQDQKTRDSEIVARRVYYDAAKGKLPFEVGNHVELVMYGNYIKEIKNA